MRAAQDEYDPAFALLSEHVSDADMGVRLGAILGLALAYAGTRREEVRLPAPVPPSLTRMHAFTCGC